MPSMGHLLSTDALDDVPWHKALLFGVLLNVLFGSLTWIPDSATLNL